MSLSLFPQGDAVAGSGGGGSNTLLDLASGGPATDPWGAPLQTEVSDPWAPPPVPAKQPAQTDPWGPSPGIPPVAAQPPPVTSDPWAPAPPAAMASQPGMCPATGYMSLVTNSLLWLQ